MTLPNNGAWACARYTASKMFARTDNLVTLPGFLRFDAAVYYTINDTVQLQVDIGTPLRQGVFRLGAQQQQYHAGLADRCQWGNHREILMKHIPFSFLSVMEFKNITAPANKTGKE